MSDENLHWAVEAGRIRGGGRKNRHDRIAPGEAVGMVAQLRESDHREHG